MKITARIGGANAAIICTPHPTDELLTCEECGDSCAGDEKAMATFVVEHTERHSAKAT